MSSLDHENRNVILRLRAEALDWLSVDDEVVVLDSRKDLYLGTNPSGAELWKALAEGSTRLGLIERLMDRYGIDRQRAVDDVDRFLSTLTENSLLEDQ